LQKSFPSPFFRVPENLRIQLEATQAAYRPGEEIRGRASWELPAPPKKVSVHLCWFTQGKGSVDSEVVAEQDFPGASPRGESTFSFRAPNEPYSYSGTLISLIWALELTAEPGEDVERVEIVIGPDRKEVDLIPSVPPEPAAGLPTSKVL
jgi:hypothetical protein